MISQRWLLEIIYIYIYLDLLKIHVVISPPVKCFLQFEIMTKITMLIIALHLHATLHLQGAFKLFSILLYYLMMLFLMI